MSEPVILPTETPNTRRIQELAQPSLYLSGYNVQRIVYELIKNYMLSNTPESCGVTLAQRYTADPITSQIRLDIAYNWKTQAMDQVPAIYVQRGDIDIVNPTMGQSTAYNIKDSIDDRMTMNQMPVIVTCVAQAPLAVVENLAEYVKQPLIYFKKEVKLDFRLREFKLIKITKPIITSESRDNFVVDLIISTAFDENWAITRESLRMKTFGLSLFDEIMQPLTCTTCSSPT